jgi:hypothetical protein
MGRQAAVSSIFTQGKFLYFSLIISIIINIDQLKTKIKLLCTNINYKLKNLFLITSTRII